MREVSQFVIVFPTRLMGVSYEEKRGIMEALRRQYPHYQFDGMESFDDDMADDDDFGVVPIMGKIGAEGGEDCEEVYMCKPLDPQVIPDLVRALEQAERQPALAN